MQQHNRYDELLQLVEPDADTSDDAQSVNSTCFLDIESSYTETEKHFKHLLEYLHALRHQTSDIPKRRLHSFKKPLCARLNRQNISFIDDAEVIHS